MSHFGNIFIIAVAQCVNSRCHPPWTTWARPYTVLSVVGKSWLNQNYPLFSFRFQLNQNLFFFLSILKKLKISFPFPSRLKSRTFFVTLCSFLQQQKLEWIFQLQVAFAINCNCFVFFQKNSDEENPPGCSTSFTSQPRPETQNLLPQVQALFNKAISLQSKGNVLPSPAFSPHLNGSSPVSPAVNLESPKLSEFLHGNAGLSGSDFLSLYSQHVCRK